MFLKHFWVEVVNWQAYAGTAAPINFNGLVRQYGLRAGGEVGDIQVNPRRPPRAPRQEPRHRPPGAAGTGGHRARHGARVKVVEVPPGPPVLPPIVTEIYGPSAAGRDALAGQIRRLFTQQDGVVDIDSTVNPPAARSKVVNRAEAARRGVPQAEIVATLAAALNGDNATAARCRQVSGAGNSCACPCLPAATTKPCWR